MDEKTTTSEKTEAESGISLLDLWMVLKKYFWRIVILTCIVTVVTGVLCKLFVQTKYTAKAVIMINPALAYGQAGDKVTVNPNEIQSDRYAVQFGKEVMPSVLKHLTTSDKLRQSIEEASKTVDNVEPLKNGVLKVTNEDDTLQVELTYTTTTSKEVAVATLNELIDIFCSSSKEKNDSDQYIYQWAGTVNVDDAARTAVPSNNWKLFTLIAFALSFIVAYVYYLIVTLVDDTIKSKTVIENITGFNVMAYIEDIELEKKDKKSKNKNNTKQKSGRR